MFDKLCQLCLPRKGRAILHDSFLRILDGKRSSKRPAPCARPSIVIGQSILKRRNRDNNISWDAQVRIVGYTATCRSFRTKLEAELRAGRVEAAAKGRTLVLSREMTLANLIDAARDNPKDPDGAALRYWRVQIGGLRLIDVNPTMIYKIGVRELRVCDNNQVSAVSERPKGNGAHGFSVMTSATLLAECRASESKDLYLAVLLSRNSPYWLSPHFRSTPGRHRVRLGCEGDHP